MKDIIKKAIMLAILAGFTLPGYGGLKYEDNGVYFGAGGRIQTQYHYTDPDDGESSDDLLFRRLRFYLEGTVHEDWKGKWQVDFGKGKVSIKDAYFQYKGFDGATVTLGNKKMPFSQELLTSSKKQQLVERTFVGDHNYGAADRQTGIHLTGPLGGYLQWSAAAAIAAHDPDNKKLDFESVIQHEAGGDWSHGPMVGGRLEFYPIGLPKKISPSQGDFKGKYQSVIAIAAFNWNNDDDNLNPIDVDEETGEQDLGKQDVDSATGFEVSAGFRTSGLSVDAQYNIFDAELVEGGVSDGIYENSETELSNFAVEAGYMLNNTLEPVVGWESQDADGYSTEWTRTSVGLNFYISQSHDIKIQTTYRMNEDKDGKDGNDVDEIFVQAQYVF